MITDTFQIRPRYSEVDQMGYVYHANYVDYCHQARTELMRKMGIADCVMEENDIILPVISFEIKYKIPSVYDELLTIETTIEKIPDLKFSFRFEIYNTKKQLVSKARSTIVFADKVSRLPLRTPDFVKQALLQYEFNNDLK